MKAQILKHTGLTEAEFYAKYKTPEDFFNSKEGKTFKAKNGSLIKKAQYSANIPGVDEFGNPIQQQQQTPFGVPGLNAPQQGHLLGSTYGGGGAKPSLPYDITWQGSTPIFTPKSHPYDTMKNTQVISQGAAEGQQKAAVDPNKAIKTGIGMVDKVISGFKALKAEKKALKSARTWRDVSAISRKASETRDVDARTQLAENQARLRKELTPTVNTEKFFPTYGVGTNVLAKAGGKLPTGGLKRSEDYGSKKKPYASVKASDFAGGGRSYPIPTIQDAGDALRLAGLHHRPDVKAKVYAKYPSLRHAQDGEIMNTYDPGFLYDDLGYEPMGESEPGFQPFPDSNVKKAYRSGGHLPKAIFGMSSMMGMMGGAGGGAASSAGGGLFSNIGGNFMQSLGGGGGSGAMTKGGFPIGAAGDQIGSIMGALPGGNSGASQIGEGFGEAAGSLFGPIGGAVGKLVGKGIGMAFGAKGERNLKRAQKETMKNTQAMGFQQGMDSFWGANSAYGEDGITLRTGGNIRNNQMGDIRIDERGSLEPISYNPFTPGTGLTSMIKGPSHSKGGTNVSYHGNMVEAEGGEPISERQDGGSVGETAAVITGDQTFNKVGANEIPELADEVGRKVKHIQRDIAKDDAKWNKLQAKNSKALADLNPMTPIDKLTFNSLTMNEKGINQHYKRNALKTQSLIAYQDAINQEAESRGLDAGALSRGQIKPLPIEEMMMFQEARNGMYLPKAQNSKKIYKDMEEHLGDRGTSWSDVWDFLTRSYDVPNLGDPAAAMGVPKATPKAPPRKPGRPAIYPQEPPAVRAAREAKQKAAADAIMKQLNPGNNFGIQDPYALQNLLASAGKVKTNATPAKTNTAANTSNTAAANAAVTTPSVSNTAGSSRGGMSNRPASTPHPNMGAQTTPGSTRTKTQPTGGGARQETLIPNTKDLPPLSQKDYDELLALYKEAEKYPDVKNPATEKFQRRYHELAGDYARAVLASEPVTSHGQRGGLTNKDLESNVDAIFGKRTKQYLAALNKPVPEKPKDVPADVPADTPVAPPDEEGVYETSPYRKYGWENLAAQVLPWLKKTPGEPLLGDQLAGEMFALSHNQVEPVQARFFHPQLDVPYDISYQDRLNENQATFNALQRAAGAGNPEALSMLAGQKYGADSNVLAEQFRANQAKKDQVYSQNRATMNQAMMTNLGLADQQYVRQQQAKSNTKLATQEALNSIAAKIGQNRLENRTLQTYANMFPDFSYGKDYNIRKTGAPTSLNMPVLYNAAGDITHVGLYDNDGKLYDYKELTPAEQKEMSKSKKPPLAGRGIVADNATTTATQKATARNGSLVRAFRDI